MNIMQAIKRIFGIDEKPRDPKPGSKKDVIAKAKAAVEEAERTCEVHDRESGILVGAGKVVLVAAVLFLGGCESLGLTTAPLDRLAAKQNAVNVAALVEENGAYLEADTAKAESLKTAQRDRNAAALELAKKMEESAR